jgi:ubiquinol-cytochrome c reductase cytochrome c1 subunit
MFGTFDRAAAQRGLQVFIEVCASCHSLDLVAFRTLTDIGYSADEVKAFAAEFEVEAEPNEDGDVEDRPALPSDYFVSPFPNVQAAAAANNGKAPPDLSLIIKSRKGGEDFTYAILVGYEDPPADLEVEEGLSYNPYFPGHKIAMPPPLSADAVEYTDGTKATVEQMAKDVTVFLAWAAEPTLEARKRMGFKVILFLIVVTVMLYGVKRKVWTDIH